MLRSLFPLFVAALVSVLEAEERPNVLLICIDDLRPELKCYGVDYIHSPNIDGIAAQGTLFKRHYVQAPTCGASRYALLTGLYGEGGNSELFKRASRKAENPESVPVSMPGWFREHGYTTVSVGKVSHHPGGRGGKDWDQSSALEMPDAWDRHLCPSGSWKHPRGIMHGLANGEIRVDAGEMAVLQSIPGEDEIYPDGIIVNEALLQMDQLAADSKKPFFLAVGIIRPHLPFGAPSKYLDRYKEVTMPVIAHPEKPAGRTTWHRSGEFMKYNRWGKDPNQDSEFATEVRRHYAACVSYADAQVGKLIEKLKGLTLMENTIIVVWGDHGWHLGEHSVWGKHTLFEESLHSPLIIRRPGQKASASNAVVQSIDLFPTLCEIAVVPAPEFVKGISLKPQMDTPGLEGRPAISYSSKETRTIRTNAFRLVVGKKHTELYDHRTAEGETKNLAESLPEKVTELKALLNAQLGE